MRLKLDLSDRCECVCVCVCGWEGRSNQNFMGGVGIFCRQHIFIVTQPKENTLLYHVFFASCAMEDAYSCISTYVCNSL